MSFAIPKRIVKKIKKRYMRISLSKTALVILTLKLDKYFYNE